MKRPTRKVNELLALVLLGHKQGALRENCPTDDKLIVLTKPIKMKQVQDASPGSCRTSDPLYQTAGAGRCSLSARSSAWWF